MCSATRWESLLMCAQEPRQWDYQNKKELAHVCDIYDEIHYYRKYNFYRIPLYQNIKICHFQTAYQGMKKWKFEWRLYKQNCDNKIHNSASPTNIKDILTKTNFVIDSKQNVIFCRRLYQQIRVRIGNISRIQTSDNLSVSIPPYPVSGAKKEFLQRIRLECKLPVRGLQETKFTNWKCDSYRSQEWKNHSHR